MKIYSLFSKFGFLFIFIGFSCLLKSNIYAQSGMKSQWVQLDSKGKLTYKTLEKGDRIMDFSFAGYKGGGVQIPVVPVIVTINPSGGDDADLIQGAVDKVSAMPLADGCRGAILLNAGNYSCSKTITIDHAGVVIRGSGSGKEGTIINMTGDPHVCFSIKGSARSVAVGSPVFITDSYLPSGTTTFNVNNASALKVGDTIRIHRPVTEAWIQFMGMDKLVRDGKKQTWINDETITDRTIQQINGTKITVDIPLTDSFDAEFLQPGGARVEKIIVSGEISEVGIENLRIISPPKVVTISENFNRAVTIKGITDSWLRDLAIENTVNSISIGGNRITVDHVNIIHSVATEGAAKPADFTVGGRQILFNQCHIKGDNLFFFVTGARVTGPNVLLNCVFEGNGWIQPHARWATGLLVDGCQVKGGGIDFMNRGEMGSGHGWTIGWAVAWNCIAKRYINQMPPGAANWVIGCKGEREKMATPFDKLPLLPEGIYDQHGSAVVPTSLYLAQLSERLGSQALVNIGYTEQNKR